MPVVPALLTAPAPAPAPSTMREPEGEVSADGAQVEADNNVEADDKTEAGGDSAMAPTASSAADGAGEAPEAEAPAADAPALAVAETDAPATGAAAMGAAAIDDPSSAAAVAASSEVPSVSVSLVSPSAELMAAAPKPLWLAAQSVQEQRTLAARLEAEAAKLDRVLGLL